MQKNNRLQQRLQLKENELLQLQLGAAIISPSPVRRKVGEEAAERLADDLHNERSGKQRRSKRRHSTRNLTDLFEERSLRLAGARMVTELFTAAKGGRNKVLQLLDYLNDRHEICHMRGGSVREERVILHNTCCPWCSKSAPQAQTMCTSMHAHTASCSMHASG